MISSLLDPLRLDFFRNGLIVAVLAGVICGSIGVYVVLRGMSYIGHGLSHSVFGGAAAAAVIQFNYFLGAGLWGVLSGLAIGRVSRQRSLGIDAAIGVVTTASFAIGIVLFNKFGQARKSLDAVLFGGILGVKFSDVYAIVAVGLMVAATLTFGHRRLLFTTFDPEVAQASGVSTAKVEAMLMVLLSLTILVTMRVIGVLLISAMLVIPAATARMLTNSFNRMMVLSPLIGGVSGAVGMLVSYYADTSSGATIILVNAALFAIVYATRGVQSRNSIGGMDDHGDRGADREQVRPGRLRNA